jgi:hypothetical protein
MQYDALSLGLLFLLVIGILVVLKSPQWPKWKAVLW